MGTEFKYIAAFDERKFKPTDKTPDVLFPIEFCDLSWFSDDKGYSEIDRKKLQSLLPGQYHLFAPGHLAICIKH